MSDLKLAAHDKRQRMIRRNSLPDIAEVELQIASWCNRSCSFCPSGTFPVPRAFMEFDLAQSLVAQLKERDFAGTVGFHLICEPLLNKRLGDFISLFRQELPGTFLRLESNGDALKDFETLHGLFERGLNEILINCYESTEQFKKRNREIIDLTKRHPEIWYRNLYKCNPPGPRSGWKVVRLRDFHDPTKATRTWGGLVEIANPAATCEAFPLRLGCSRPFKRLHVNYLGQAILCNNDWKFEVVCGDLKTQSLGEVWGSETLVRCRERLERRDRDMPLCCKCDQGLPGGEIDEPNADGQVALRHFIVMGRRHARGILRRLGGAS